eukprot:365776-Chlamydomonas_euryale.AAC.14
MGHCDIACSMTRSAATALWTWTGSSCQRMNSAPRMKRWEEKVPPYHGGACTWSSTPYIAVCTSEAQSSYLLCDVAHIIASKSDDAIPSFVVKAPSQT